MHALAPLIYDLAIMLGLAAIVVVIFQRIRQPVVLGYLVAGMIAGPHTPPYRLITDVSSIQTLSELGVIFLMFSIGLEFSFKKLKKVGVSASFTGLIEVLLMFLLGHSLGHFMGWAHYDSIFLGAALSISSTTIIVKAIEELGLKSKHFAQLIVGVLVVEDLLAILILVVLSTIVVTNHVFSYDLFSAIVKLVIVIGGWFLLGYFFVPPLFRGISHYISDETLTIISVALCLFLVAVASKFGYSAALGAFIMGSILAETVVIARIEFLIRPIRDVFAAVFFISVGMMIDPHVIVDEWQAILLITIVTILGKMATTIIAALTTGQTVNTAIRSGFSMAQIGEFSFIMVGLGLALQVLSSKIYPMIVAVSSITTFTTPYFIRASGVISERIEKAMPKNFREWLSHYAKWMRAHHQGDKYRAQYMSLFMRLMANGIVVAIIFTVFDQIIFQQFSYFRSETWDANTLSLVIALIISSPFIWGMLFSFKKLKFKKEEGMLFDPLAWLIWSLTFLEVALLAIVYFQSWLTVVLFILMGILLFISMYKQIDRSYRWFEKNLMNNLSGKHKGAPK